MPVHDMIEEAGDGGTLILIEFREQVSPVAGEMLEDRLTMVLSPLSAVTVMVELPVAPARAADDVGLMLRLKS